MADKLAPRVDLSRLKALILDPKSWGRGVWFYAICRALRSRTDDSIKLFITTDVPIILNLLCTVCSHEARHLVAKRHPSKYVEIYDARGERIGMYLWVFDLHNDVNKRLGGEIFSREDIDLFYLPLLELTTKQINEDYFSAMKADTLDQLWEVSFNPESWGYSTLGGIAKGPNPDPASWGPGVWFYSFCRALRSRDDETIDAFIGYDVPILVGLLCSVCSEEAYKLIQARHPSTYRGKQDYRGERIGMYLWISDLHNDVNKRLDKPYYPQDFIDQMYKPLLSLTTREINQDAEMVLKPETIPKLRHIVYGTELLPSQTTSLPPYTIPAVPSAQGVGEKPGTAPESGSVAGRIRGSAVVRLPIAGSSSTSRRLNPAMAAAQRRLKQ